jgi:hypothetical protein
MRKKQVISLKINLSLEKKALPKKLLSLLILAFCLMPICMSVCVAEESTSLSISPFLKAEIRNIGYDAVYGTEMVRNGSEVSIKVVFTNISKEIDTSTLIFHSEIGGAVGSISGEGLQGKELQSGSTYTLDHKKVVKEVVVTWSVEAPEVGKRTTYTLLNITQETTEGTYLVVDITKDVSSEIIEDAVVAIDTAKNEVEEAKRVIANATGVDVSGAKTSLDLANEHLNNSNSFYNEGKPKEALEEAERASDSAKEAEDKAKAAIGGVKYRDYGLIAAVVVIAIVALLLVIQKKRRKRGIF